MTPQDYREDWTQEEAWDAHMKYTVAGGRPSPNSPFPWWEGRRELRELERQCPTLPAPVSKMRAVMDAIELCLMHEWPVPEWAAQSFRYAFSKLRHLEARTWDAVLGKPTYLPKGKRLAAERERRHLTWPVYASAQALIRQGRPIGKLLFEDVAAHIEETLGVKMRATKADKLYYAYLATLPEDRKSRRKLPRK